MTENELTFTGERFLPDCEREIWYEHYHRYAMALDWVDGKVVLDAACGEGYGTHLLAQKAQSVIGVDIDEVAIKHANDTYNQPNLSYQESNVLNFNFEDGTFDVVVSFETLEHLAEHDELLTEFKRVLKPEGILIISTPDKSEYSDKTGFDNEYHVRELYTNEFKELISRFFKRSHWFGQKLMFSSTIWQLNKSIKSVKIDSLNDSNQVFNKLLFNPIYLIVVASNSDLEINNGNDFYHFTEQSEQIYGHYNAVIRAHIKAEQDCKLLTKQQQTWIQHPIIGRCIKWFGRK